MSGSLDVTELGQLRQSDDRVAAVKAAGHSPVRPASLVGAVRAQDGEGAEYGFSGRRQEQLRCDARLRPSDIAFCMLLLCFAVQCRRDRYVAVLNCCPRKVLYVVFVDRDFALEEEPYAGYETVRIGKANFPARHCTRRRNLAIGFRPHRIHAVHKTPSTPAKMSKQRC